MAANCNYKVKLIGALDMRRFKNNGRVVLSLSQVFA